MIKVALLTALISAANSQEVIYFEGKSAMSDCTTYARGLHAGAVVKQEGVRNVSTNDGIRRETSCVTVSKE